MSVSNAIINCLGISSIPEWNCMHLFLKSVRLKPNLSHFEWIVCNTSGVDNFWMFFISKPRQTGKSDSIVYYFFTWRFLRRLFRSSKTSDSKSDLFRNFGEKRFLKQGIILLYVPESNQSESSKQIFFIEWNRMISFKPICCNVDSSQKQTITYILITTNFPEN